MILVVGATGDLGQRVTRKLRESGAAVRAMVRPRTADASTSIEATDIVRGDLTDPASLAGACAGADTVVLTATAIGRRLSGERISLRDVDERGALALVDAAENAGVTRFVYVSFPGIDSGMGTALERAKGAVEERLRASTMRPVIVRADGFHEIHLGALGRFDVASGKVSIIGRGDTPRRWIATEDVAALVAAVTTEADPPQVIEVGGPDAISKNDLVRAAERAGGSTIKVRRMPRALARVMIRVTGLTNDALASALGAGLHQDLVPATWDDSALRERGIAPSSPTAFVERAATASKAD